MDPAAVLTRASVQLRGRLPTQAELDRAEAGQLDPVLDSILADPAVGDRIADLVANRWRVRIDQIDPLRPPGELQRSLGDEPLKILARIVNEDLPYTELVTGRWTMADENTASIWPLDYPAGASGWQVAHYTDERPESGVLSSNGLWWRYGTTKNNLSRGRANALTRILLCTDFAARPVVLDRSETGFDAAALREQTRTTPSCIGCHSAIDPIGSFLFGFGFSTETRKYASYDPGGEDLWRRSSGIAPSYFGQPGWTLTDLGNNLAADPRFITCAVRTVWEALVQRAAGPADEPALVRHREAFLDGDVTVRALLRSMFTDQAWRAAGDLDAPDSAQLMSPTTYARVVEQLTGLRWTYEGVGMLENDTAGIRTLAGGADGVTVFVDSALPIPSQIIAYRTFAEVAAMHAVVHDRDRDPADRLFTDAALRGEDREAATAALARRVLGRAITDADRADATALWDDAFALSSDPATAWAAVLAWLLGHPDFVTY